VGYRSKRTDCQGVLRAAGETDTTEDCFELDHGDPGLHLLVFE
jgi:hypothetical protein